MPLMAAKTPAQGTAGMTDRYDAVAADWWDARIEALSRAACCATI